MNAQYAFRTVVSVTLGVLLAANVAAAIAQSSAYPSRPIRILVPFPPGGAADTIGRTTGEQLAVQMAQPVVIDNRPGAGGRLATDILANATPDGYTLLVGTVGGIAISPSLYRKLSYDPDRDILSISSLAEIINVMVVSAAVDAPNVKAFIDWSRKQGGAVRFGSSGTGQPDHLAGEFFQRAAGIKMTHIPYKGGGPALIDLIANDLQLMFATYVVALPHIKSGRLRLLGVTTPERQPLMPDVPAMAETIPGFGLRNWNGLFAPGRTPPTIADRLFREVQKALQSPELQRRQAAAGIVPAGSDSREGFARYVREDAARWAKIVKQAGIIVE